MTSTPKVSSCVDCGTTIIGERLRCPACHDTHAVCVVAAHSPDVPDAVTDATTNATTNDAMDDAVTAPRSRQRVRIANRSSASRRLVVIVGVLVIVALAIVFSLKVCAR